VLCSDSDFVNCILHAFNLSYEHACKDALGDQGMNQCTVFQMCFLSILMLKTIKKQSSAATTKAIFDDKYRESSQESFIQAFVDLIEKVDEVQAGDGVDGSDDFGLEDLLKEVAGDKSTADGDNSAADGSTRWNKTTEDCLSQEEGERSC
jgi:hypothetical protein